MTAEPFLAVHDIDVVYKGAILALRGVSLTVAKGQVVAILGANGAGKTTTLRAISGFIGLDAARVTKGTIVFEGERLDNRQPHHCARLGIALVPEREKIFPSLTVGENLLVPPSRLSGAERRRMEELVFQFFPALAQRRASQAGLLSGGERQMLGIAAKLVSGPRMLLIDELSLGLAPIVVQQLMERLLKIREELGLALLLVEQNATLALNVADYAYVLENGVIALEGDGASMRANPRIHEFYLGIASAARRSYRDARNERLAGAKNG
jgi:branched-chain amino acid transport system ATP-binding protein